MVDHCFNSGLIFYIFLLPFLAIDAHADCGNHNPFLFENNQELAAIQILFVLAVGFLVIAEMVCLGCFSPPSLIIS